MKQNKLRKRINATLKLEQGYPVYQEIYKALHVSPDYLLRDKLDGTSVCKICEIEML